jgi:pimeloyl-ACP methyl ester carboxylesterase
MEKVESSAIVILPGLDGTGELLKPLVDGLSLHRLVQLIAYPTDQQLGYDQLVTFVAKRAPKGNFFILGESFSGPIAIEFAATNPHVVGLILASSFARHPLPKLLLPFVRILDMRWIPSSIVVSMLLGSTGTDELKSHLIRVLRKLPPMVIRARASEVLRVDKRSRLREITCPVLCLHGRYDRLVRRKYVDEIALAQPGCRVSWFDASHMLLETHPDEASKAINEFCELVN